MKMPALGYDVDVTHEILEGSVVEITARRGEDSHVHRITVGAVDQPLPKEYDQAQAQKDLDDARCYAAEMAASKSKRRDIAANLK
jgi:hypothetical protein